MDTIINVIHVIAALSLILTVLLQAGKGAAMGSGLGGGSSQTMFGSSGAGNFLTKLTTGIAILFMVTSLTLAVFSTKKKSKFSHNFRNSRFKFASNSNIATKK